MMSFGHQLKLLLWKNYILRKRHKVRLVLELLWPLALFLILMWIRQRGLIPKPACHLIEKALPSVGGFPFLQNFICSLSNTCYESYVEDNNGKDQWADGILSKLVTESAPILYDLVGTSQGVSDFTSFLTLVNDGMKIIRKRMSLQEGVDLQRLGDVPLVSFLNQTTEDQKIEIFFRSGIADELRDTTVHLSEFSTESYDQLMSLFLGADEAELHNDIWSCDGKNREDYKLISISDYMWSIYCDAPVWENQLRKAFLKYFRKTVDRTTKLYAEMVRVYNDGDVDDSLFAILNLTSQARGGRHEQTAANIQNLSRVAGEFGGMRGQGVTGEDSERSLSSLFQSFCGSEMSSNTSILGVDATNQYDSLRDRLRDWRQTRRYQHDPDVSPNCNQILEELESQPATSLMWRLLKPFIRGKLLYYPRTEFTESLMGKVDDKISALEELGIRFNQGIRILHQLQLWLDANKEDVELLKRVFRGNFVQNLGFSAMESLFFPPNLNADLLNIPILLDSIDMNFPQRLLGMINSDSKILSAIVNCTRYKKSTYRKSGVTGNNSPEFLSEKDAVADGMQLMLDNNLWAVIIFLDLPADGSSPPHLKYKIRMDSDKVDGTRITRDRITRRHPRSRPTLDLKYLTNGFLYIQELIEQSFIENTTANANMSNMAVVLQQFPFPCYNFDQFIRAISSTFPLFMVLSWVYAAAMLIKSIVLEKELRLKEVMRVMGCGNSVIWTAWFIDSFAAMSISSFLLAIILKFGNILQNSDFGVILIFLLFFSVATISFCFLVSTFFTKANSAAATGGILFFLSYLPYNFILIWEDRLTWFHTMFSCLISNVAFGFGCTYIARLEEDGLGAQWNRLSISNRPGDDFNFSYCLIMLLFDAFIYLFMALYIEAVFPGENGTPRKWYFFIQKSFWIPGARLHEKMDTGAGGCQAYMDLNNQPIVEAEPDGIPCGVSVRHLSKKYNNGRVALSDLNISFYEGQITSFLGHNGAGKTTTISILTGLFPPTDGTAFIYGFDIRKDIDEIRKDIGICPQHNVLFDRLTVAEHLQFYADLKGKAKVAETEMDQMLLDLGIPHKKNEFPKNLSGGMKRKLSVAAAFVGGSRTIFLDEPTSGVDPYSRRSIWDLLLKYKTGRTVILTTHFMDEADILGDRIAIISRGQLKACGSSLFLKTQFGQGYNLRLVREMGQTPGTNEGEMVNNVPSSQATDDNVSQVTAISYMTQHATAATRHTQLFANFIKERIPDAKLVSDALGSDVIFLLPNEKVEDFENLFNDLDENMSTLKLLSYGISDTSLEDVFLQITIKDLGEATEDHSNKICQWGCCQCWERKKTKLIYENNNVLGPQIYGPLQPGSSFISSKVFPVSLPEVASAGNPSPPPPEEQLSSEITPESPINPQHIENPVNQVTPIPVVLDLVEPVSGEVDVELEETLLPRTRRESSLFGIQRHNFQSHVWVQFWVIVLKRFRNSNRNRKAMFFEIVVPALFIALMLASTLILPPPGNEASREITFTVYEPPNNIFFSLPNDKSESFEDTLSELTGVIGLGTPCMKEHLPEGNCNGGWSQDAVSDFSGRRADSKNGSLGKCTCPYGSHVCDSDVETPPPPKFGTRTKDFLLDVSKYNVAEWVLKTYFLYEPKRLGGFEMKMREPEAYTVSEFFSLADTFSQFSNMKNRKEIKPPTPGPKSSKSFYKVWFENRAWLSSPAYLNGLHNVLLRQKLQPSQKEAEGDYGITLYTHPMNLTEHQQKKESLKTAALGVVHAICVIFALSFVPASFTVYLIEERKSGAKHLHLISGVKPITYWISNLSFDMIKYLFSAMLCVFLFYLFDAEAYIGKKSVAGFITLLILYGWAAIPLMYPFSYVFGIPSTAFVVLACLNLFIGLITTVSTFVLEELGDPKLTEISEVLGNVFLIFPQYCLGHGLVELVKLHIQGTAFGNLNWDVDINRFEWEILGRLLVCLGIQGFVFFLLSVLTEYKQWLYLLCCKKRINRKEQWAIETRGENGENDEDVEKEAVRVIQNPPPYAPLLARNLGKIYAGKKRAAVNNLCFAVEPGECFGLLGVNGAGKSTTFKMLTGDERITAGKAYIMSWDVEMSLDEARKHYGYCPQEDGIDPLLNSYEQLELYGRLRGLTSREVRRTARELISSLGLTRYASRRCGTYSGGNKRKLSTAIALIGNPQVLFLDEPTSGMDPGARRQLWKLITGLTGMGKSVILTSHSMEECEALCTRIAIMVNGKFVCLGSLQHLKNRFGSGYRLSVRCPVLNQSEFRSRCEKSLSFAELEDVHSSQMKLKLPKDKVKLGEIFSAMCSARVDGLIEDFSVSQTTLDDIFIKFASGQRDELDAKPEAVAGKQDNIEEKPT